MRLRKRLGSPGNDSPRSERAGTQRILTRSHGGALAAENPLPATRAAASALPVEDSQEAFSTERCCTAKAKCAWPVKHCSFSNRDRPLSWTGVAPAGFGPADAGDGVDGDYALHSHLTNSDEPTLVASRRAGGDFSPTEESFFGETASRTLREYAIDTLFFSCQGWSAIAACMRVRKPTPPC